MLGALSAGAGDEELGGATGAWELLGALGIGAEGEAGGAG